MQTWTYSRNSPAQDKVQRQCLLKMSQSYGHTNPKEHLWSQPPVQANPLFQLPGKAVVDLSLEVFRAKMDRNLNKLV